MIYTTLFDKNFLAAGLCMIRSLTRHSAERPIVYVLAMDGLTETLLPKLAPPGVVQLVPHDLFEGVLQLDLRKKRTWQEYCWTCASLFTNFVANNTEDCREGLNLTYLDADMYFYSDPAVVHAEIGTKRIGIIPHRFNEEYEKKYGGNGKFNVSWVTFKANLGRTVLRDWSSKCREWCFYRNEDGKFGDQAYLDRWPEEWPWDVHVIHNIGAGAAPWNLMNYIVVDGPNHQVMLAENVPGEAPLFYTPLVFYHFHQYKHGTPSTPTEPGTVSTLSPEGPHRRTLHKLPPNADLIYKPYEAEMESTYADLSLAGA